MGKTTADKLWEDFVNKMNQPSIPSKSRESPKSRTSSKARAPSKSRETPAKKSERVVSDCSKHVAPCPSQCVEYTNKKGEYKCRTRPASKVTRTVSKKEPEMVAIQQNQYISPKSTPRVIVGEDEDEIIFSKPQVRPPKVPIFSKPIEIEKEVSKKSRWNTYAEQMPIEGNTKVRRQYRANYNSSLNDGSLETLFMNVVETPFEKEVEKAIEVVLESPQGQKQEDKLESAGERVGVDVSDKLNQELEKGQEEIQTYNALRAVLSDEEKATIVSEVKRINAEVALITGDRKKVSKDEVPQIQKILEDHRLCSLIKNTETRVYKSGAHSGEHTLKYLRAVAKFLNIKGHSVAPRGELCFLIAQVISKSESEFARHLESKEKSRLSNVTRRLPETRKSTVSKKVSEKASK